MEKRKSNLTKWGIKNYAKCDCRIQIQTMHNIFNESPLTKHEIGLEDLHEVTLDAKGWINNLQIKI